MTNTSSSDIGNQNRPERKAPENISYYEHEEEVFRMERHCKRLFIALILAIVLIFASNGVWLLYESLYDTISYAQDGQGINNINTGTQGDVVDGTENAGEAP